jgi:hypothetical protein
MDADTTKVSDGAQVERMRLTVFSNQGQASSDWSKRKTQGQTLGFSLPAH